MNTPQPQRYRSGQPTLAWLIAFALLGALAMTLQACSSTPEPVPGPPPTAQAGLTPSVVPAATPLSATPLLTVTAASSPTPPLQVTSTITALLTISPTATATPCPPPPPGWLPYVVQAGDTLYDLSLRAGISQASIVAANCLTSASLLSGQTLFLPPLPEPTATPCVVAAPAGWQSYTVRAGDTLSALAATRGTTVEQIMQVNCLGSTMIRVGDTLFLPPLAVGAAPPLPTAPTVDSGGGGGGPSVVCPGFSCPSSDLPDLNLAPGGPNDPSFQPCAPARATPWVSAEKAIIEMGERLYLFACDFTTRPISATITVNGVVQPIPLTDSLRNLDLQKGPAQAIVEWLALPDRPLGLHRLTIYGENGESTVPFNFIVEAPSGPHILVDPQAASPGSTFTVYYINFDLNSAPTIALYGEDLPAVGADHSMSGRGTWTVLIDRPLPGMAGKGWTAAPLSSRPQDRRAAYAVSYNNQAVYDLFWLW